MVPLTKNKPTVLLPCSVEKMGLAGAQMFQDLWSAHVCKTLPRGLFFHCQSLWVAPKSPIITNRCRRRRQRSISSAFAPGLVYTSATRSRLWRSTATTCQVSLARRCSSRHSNDGRRRIATLRAPASAGRARGGRVGDRYFECPHIGVKGRIVGFTPCLIYT